MMKSTINLRSPKRGDLMVEEIKRWVADQNLRFTRFGQFWNDINQASQLAFRTWIEGHVPWLWNSVQRRPLRERGCGVGGPPTFWATSRLSTPGSPKAWRRSISRWHAAFSNSASNREVAQRRSSSGVKRRDGASGLADQELHSDERVTGEQEPQSARSKEAEPWNRSP